MGIPIQKVFTLDVTLHFSGVIASEGGGKGRSLCKLYQVETAMYAFPCGDYFLWKGEETDNARGCAQYEALTQSLQDKGWTRVQETRSLLAKDVQAKTKFEIRLDSPVSGHQMLELRKGALADFYSSEEKLSHALGRAGQSLDEGIAPHLT